MPIVYEVSLTADAAIAAVFDEWLIEHVNRMVRLPGFLDADIERADAPDDAHILRVARYRLENRAALERYYEHNAETMRAEGLDRFDTRFSATRRVLEPAAGDPTPGTELETCGNCEMPLSARYCPACGQDSYRRVTSLGEILKDFFGDYLNLDSRLAQSMGPLIAKPGFLTREYLVGHRARYIPPLRLYLVISILFFFLLSVTAFGVPWVANSASMPVNVKLTVDKKKLAKLREMPAWRRQIARNALKLKSQPRAFLHDIVRNLPTVMFILLPIFALVLKLLYIRRKRYYVEHLIFAAHYHANVFLAATFFLIVDAIAPRFGYAAISDALAWFLWAYLTIYLIVAMRVVYAQGIIKTTVKWFLLACLYGLALVIALLIAVGLAFLSSG